MGEGAVSGEEDARRLGDTDALVAARDVAQRQATVEDVIPGQRLFVGLARELVQGEVADEPRCVEAAAVKAVAGRLGDEAGGDVKRHGADDVAGTEAVDGTAVVVAQVNFNVPGLFLNADGAGVPGSGLGEAQHGLGWQGG